MNYYPIPTGVSVSDSVVASLGPTECDPKVFTDSKTVTFVMPKSTDSLQKRVDSDLYEKTVDLDGSWRQIRESGQIKMTPYRVVSETHKYFVSGVTRLYCVHDIAKIGKASAKVGGACRPCKVVLVDVKLAKVQGRYVEQGDLDYWKSKYPDAPHFKGLPTLDPAKIEAAKAEVISNLLQAYNLGEELVELRETVASVSKLTREAIGLITKFRPMITSLVERGLKKEAASRWMEFRYGIMPIIYSIQDILALKAETGLYRTARAKVRPDEPDYDDPWGTLPAYFEDRGTSKLRCSITAKARWASEELKCLDLINVNPITTAFEVYPWAMVVRWFINVSTFITSRVKSHTSLASELHACVAIREETEYGTYLCTQSSYNIIPSWNGDSRACGAGYYGVHTFPALSDHVIESTLLAWHRINNYNRYLYQPSDVKLVFSPHMTWKRIVDALILGQGQLSKSLRRLK